MPRAIWSGSISFGLVNAPVRMYSAIAEETVRFHLVHQKDLGRIGFEKVCKAEDGKPVPNDEIAKAYEYGEDDLVVMEDEDFAAAEAEAYRQFEVLDFVAFDQIDPIYFERTYYLGPVKGAERVYALLRDAMADAGLAAVGRYVFHGKECLGLLRAREGVIALERMYFADEIRPFDEIAEEAGERAAADELTMAKKLIEAYTRDFEPERYHDTYRERLLAIIERKHEGKPVKAPKAPKQTGPPDLMEALKASLSALGEGKGDGRAAAAGNGGSRDGRGSADGDGLEELTVDELRERAKDARIRGRSKMNKEELVEALDAA
jgi:DNA end-binding protein Ku